MNKIKVSLILVNLLVCSCARQYVVKEAPKAEIVEQESTQHIYVSSIDELKKQYQKNHYSLHTLRDMSVDVPPIMVDQLPVDWKTLSYEEKKDVFIQTILPLALAVSQQIAEEKNMLEEAIQADDQEIIDLLSAKYKAKDLNELQMKLQPIPTSIILAQAIIESGWGMSYFALEGNALFGEVGTTGLSARKNLQRKLKKFDSLEGSIAAYCFNLNTHPAYSGFRELRHEYYLHGNVNFDHIVGELTAYSIKGKEYTDTLIKIINMYALYQFDIVGIDQSKPVLQIQTRMPTLKKSP